MNKPNTILIAMGLIAIGTGLYLAAPFLCLLFAGVVCIVGGQQGSKPPPQSDRGFNLPLNSPDKGGHNIGGPRMPKPDVSPAGQHPTNSP